MRISDWSSDGCSSDLDPWDLTDAIPALAALPSDAPVSPSLAAWAVVVKTAVDLVGRGRLTPGTTPEGVAAWHVGPLDPSDERLLDELALRLPPEEIGRAHV